MNMRATLSLVFGFASIPLEKIAPVVSIAAALAGIIAAVPLIAQRYKIPVRRVVIIAVSALVALFALCGCSLKPLKTPPYPGGVYPQMSAEAYAAAKAKSSAQVDALQALTSHAPPTALEMARARSYGQWQIAAMGFVALAVILFCAKYPAAALCFLGGGVFCGFFGNAFTSSTVATVMIATGVAGAVFFLAWQVITRAIPRYFPAAFPPASATA